MIGKISGRIEYRTTDHVLIDVRGVGYIVYCSERTLMEMVKLSRCILKCLCAKI